MPKIGRKAEPTKSVDPKQDGAKKAPRKRRSGGAFSRAMQMIAQMRKENNPAKFISAARHTNIVRQRMRKIARENGDDTEFKFSTKFMQHFHILGVSGIVDFAKLGMQFSRHAGRTTLMDRDISAAAVAINTH